MKQKKQPSTKSTYPKPKGWEYKDLKDEYHRGPEVVKKKFHVVNDVNA